MAENLYEREKLYNEVWDEPVYIVAKRLWCFKCNDKKDL